MFTRSSKTTASNASINTHHSSARLVRRSAKPPTYTSTATTVPAYTSNEPNATGSHNPNERPSTRRAGLLSASVVATPGSDAMFEQAESSLTETASVGGMSAENTRAGSPRYIYYRVYAEDGAIPSGNPVYTDDPSLGRILAKLVTPPHTAISVKRCLSHVENIDDKISTKLFVATSSQTPMDDTGRISILAYPGPGCTPNEPMALVAVSTGGKSLHAIRVTIPAPDPPAVLARRPTALRSVMAALPPALIHRSVVAVIPPASKLHHATARSLAPLPSQSGQAHSRDAHENQLDAQAPDTVFLPSVEGPTPFETRYLYYRVYKASGAVRSKQPASSNDPSVGRISVDSVPPPHTAISVMRCISKIEQLSNPDESQLFVDISSEFPIGEGQFSILTSDRPGSTQEDPIVLVEAPCPTFTMRMRVTSTQEPSDQNPGWLATTEGEILRISPDSLQPQQGVQHANRVYEAINAAGQMGLVQETCVAPIGSNGTG